MKRRALLLLMILTGCACDPVRAREYSRLIPEYRAVAQVRQQRDSPALSCVLDRGGTTRDAADAQLVRARADEFIHYYFDVYSSGVPQKQEREIVLKMVTPEFGELLSKAVVGEACFQEREPGPPIVWGDLFTSHLEGATSAVVKNVHINRQRAEARIAWSYVDNRSKKSFEWMDSVEMERTPTGWLISDFIHLGTWEFMHKGSVTDRLAYAASQCNSSMQDARSTR